MVVFLTRKYPPSTGGMETFSYQLNRHYPDEHRLIHYGKSQTDILFAIPILLFRAWRMRKEATAFHIGDGVLAPLAPLLRLWFRGPIVITIHALEILYPSRILQWLIHRSLPFTSHIVAVSQFTADTLQTQGTPTEKISVITHGVEHIRPVSSSQQAFTDAKHHAKSALYSTLIDHPIAQRISEEEWMNATLILSVGRLVKRKGIVWALENVLPRIIENSLTPVYYIIIGSGPERERIAKTIEKQKLQDSIFLLGRTSQSTLETSYSAADIFLMPNISVEGDAEGFGFVAIEAAAAGLPVLSSAIEGIPSAIHNQMNGILVETKNTDQYTEALFHWIESPEDRINFGYRASQYTAAHFQWSNVADRYKKLFDSLQQQ